MHQATITKKGYRGSDRVSSYLELLLKVQFGRDWPVHGNLASLDPGRDDVGDLDVYGLAALAVDHTSDARTTHPTQEDDPRW